jgi:hypothetical protein
VYGSEKITQIGLKRVKQRAQEWSAILKIWVEDESPESIAQVKGAIERLSLDRLQLLVPPKKEEQPAKKEKIKEIPSCCQDSLNEMRKVAERYELIEMIPFLLTLDKIIDAIEIITNPSELFVKLAEPNEMEAYENAMLGLAEMERWDLILIVEMELLSHKQSSSRFMLKFWQWQSDLLHKKKSSIHEQ